MLHENAKQRLWRVVPTEYDIEYYDPIRDQLVEETVELDPERQIRWARQGAAPQYPCIYLEVAPEGQPRGDIGHIFSDGVYKEPVPEDESVAYRKYTAAYHRARLDVTVAVKTGTPSMPRRVLADTIAQQCWHAFRFETDHLKEPGTAPDGTDLPFAVPMRLRQAGSGMSDLSMEIDEQHVERRRFEFSIEYPYFREEEVPDTEAVVWQVGVDNDGDDEIEGWGGWQSTDGEVDPGDHTDG